MQYQQSYTEEEIKFVYNYMKDKGYNKLDIINALDGKHTSDIKVSPLMIDLHIFNDILKKRFIIDYQNKTIMTLDGKTLETLLSDKIKLLFDKNIRDIEEEKIREKEEIINIFKGK